MPSRPPRLTCGWGRAHLTAEGNQRYVDEFSIRRDTAQRAKEKFPLRVKLLSLDFRFRKVFMSRSIGRVAALVGHFAIAGIGMSAALPPPPPARWAAHFSTRPPL